MTSGQDGHIHGLSPEQIAEAHKRFAGLRPRGAGAGSGSGWTTRAHEFFKDVLPPGGSLSPLAGKSFQRAAGADFNPADIHPQDDVGISDVSSMSHIAGGGGGSGGGNGGRGGGGGGGGRDGDGFARQGNWFSGGGGGSAGSYFSRDMSYMPELATPDRLSFPTSRALMNNYARMFYKTDAVVGTCIDMQSQAAFSSFEFVGEGVDGEVLDDLHKAVDACRVISMLPKMLTQQFVLGEACVHMIWDDTQGIWSFLGLHDPDYINVLSLPLLGMGEPICQFIPDRKLRDALASSHPKLVKFRSTLPPELVSAIRAGMPVDLEETNFTFLPRKLFDSDVRGTSIFAKLWRTFMIEDGYAAATIATTRRNAHPIKVLKVGDPSTGFIPDQGTIDEAHRLVAQAEIDPGGGWLAYHYAINAEFWGAAERALNLRDQQDYILQQKLAALGVSPGLLSGEVTYASAGAGLTVYLQKLRSLRDGIEADWLVKKFIQPMVEMRAWVKRSTKEIDSIRNGAGPAILRRKADVDYIQPMVQWSRPLDPSVDDAKLSAIGSLEGLGVRFSQQTKMALVGHDYREEVEQRVREARQMQEIIRANPDVAVAPGVAGAAPGGDMGMGGMGGGLPPLPPMPGEGLGDDLPPLPSAPQSGPGPGPASPDAEGGQRDSDGRDGSDPRATKKPESWQDGGDAEGGFQAAVQGLGALLRGETPQGEAGQARLVRRFLEDERGGDPLLRGFRGDLQLGARREAWNRMRDWLFDQGVPRTTVNLIEQHLG